jgi:hypothetical protein
MELRELIFRTVAENPTWGAPRIHEELKMLGFDIRRDPCCVGCERLPEILSPQRDGWLF